MQADGKSIVALAVDEKNSALGTQCGETWDIATIMYTLMLGLHEEVRYAVISKLATHDMLLNDMKQEE